jgi:hypothetical protein
MMTSMAEAQQATPPTWRGRSRLSLLRDVLGGWSRTWDRVRQLAGLLSGYLFPRRVRARLERLRALGHVAVVPTLPQLLVAARDQMMLGASAETKLFYRSQGIPWVFHNLRRFLSGPATMLDPVGLFSPRDAIIHHVLQTFHRHPVYDLVLLRGHLDGLEEMQRQAEQVRAGTHPHQRALASLIEDGGYHARLPDDVAAFRADPFIRPRPVPPGLVADPYLMLAMDQFKDLRGFTNYAARLDAGLAGALWAWLLVGWNETLGGALHLTVGPTRVRAACCDADIVARVLPERSAADENRTSAGKEW